MANSSRFNFRDLAIFGITLLICLVIFFSKTTNNLLQDGLGKLISPVTSSLYSIRANGFGVFSASLNKKNEEVISLKEKNENLEASILKYKSIEEENLQMRRLLGTNLPASWKFSIAKVTQKTADTISIISESQIYEGETVILPKEDLGDSTISQSGVYVGKVERVGQPAQVLLPTSTSSRISVSVYKQDNYSTTATGILVGRGSRVLLDQILTSETLNVGDWVVTQDNLLVGKIEKVIESTNGTFKQADVLPIVDATKLSRVFIVTKK